MFNPLRLQGSFEVPSSAESAEIIVDRLATAIRNEKPRKLSVGDGVITFTGGPFRNVNSRNHLTQISIGSITVKACKGDVHIKYDLKLGGVILAFALASGTLGLIVYFFGRAWEGVVFWGFISVLTFALQYIKVVTRFPRFLRGVGVSPSTQPLEGQRGQSGVGSGKGVSL